MGGGVSVFAEMRSVSGDIGASGSASPAIELQSRSNRSFIDNINDFSPCFKLLIS